MTNGTAAEQLLRDKRAELASVEAQARQTVSTERLWVLNQRALRLRREIAELEASIAAAKERGR